MNLCLLIIPSFYTHFQHHMITLANLTRTLTIRGQP